MDFFAVYEVAGHRSSPALLQKSCLIIAMLAKQDFHYCWQEVVTKPLFLEQLVTKR